MENKLGGLGSRVLEYAKKLEGISKNDWKFLSCIINDTFNEKVRELEPTLKLSCKNDIEPIIRSRLG